MRHGNSSGLQHRRLRLLVSGHGAEMCLVQRLLSLAVFILGINSYAWAQGPTRYLTIAGGLAVTPEVSRFPPPSPHGDAPAILLAGGVTVGERVGVELEFATAKRTEINYRRQLRLGTTGGPVAPGDGVFIRDRHRDWFLSPLVRFSLLRGDRASIDFVAGVGMASKSIHRDEHRRDSLARPPFPTSLRTFSRTRQLSQVATVGSDGLVWFLPNAGLHIGVRLRNVNREDGFSPDETSAFVFAATTGVQVRF